MQACRPLGSALDLGMLTDLQIGGGWEGGGKKGERKGGRDAHFLECGDKNTIKKGATHARCIQMARAVTLRAAFSYP